jgi:PAS domain S-box-containing protein
MGMAGTDPAWAHFEPLFEGSADCLILLEADSGLIVAANPMLARQLGVGAEDVRGKPFFAVPAFKPLAAHEAAYRELAAEIAGRPRDVTLKSPRDEDIHFSIRGVAYAAQGKRYLLLRFRALQMDTRSSDTLMKSTWLARLVFENAPDGISVRAVSADFARKKLLACNQRYIAMTGRTEAELMAMENIGACVRSLLTPDQDAEMERKLRAMESVRGLGSWIRPDGQENAFEWHAVPMRVNHQVFLLGIDRDITAQWRAQAELNALISNIPDLVWFKDTRSRYVSVNAAFLKAVNKTLDELRGKTDYDISPPETAAKYQADDARVVSDKTVLTVEEKHELIGRPPAWIVTTKSPILDKDGNVLGTVGIARDITDRRKTELELREQRERLETILTKVPSEYIRPHRGDTVVGPIIEKVLTLRESGAQKKL